MSMDQSRVKGRIPELDFLRGLALILMMFHHTIADLYDIYSRQFVAFQHSFWFYELGRPIVLTVFLTVSGTSSRFSRNSMKRGIRMVLFSIAATALTIFVDGFAKTGIIYFNVIHVVALSTVLYALFEKLAIKKQWIPDRRSEDENRDYKPHLFAGFLIVTGVFLVFLGPLTAPLIPDYSNNVFLIMLGSVPRGVYILDHMPLLPWLGFFIVGAALGYTLYLPGQALTKSEGLFFRMTRPVRFLGRHSLWVYFLHQPIILFILWLLNMTGIFA